MYAKIHFTSFDWPQRGLDLRGRLETDAPAEEGGTLALTWTDAQGRILDRKKCPINREQVRQDASGLREIPFALPTARALTAFNCLHAELRTNNGEHAEDDTEFFVILPADPLDDYHVIMYYAYQPHQQNALRQYSICYGKASPGSGNRSLKPETGKRWYEHGFGFYCDQTAVPLFAEYHSPYYSSKSFQMDRAKELYLADKSKKEAFIRRPSFHDEEAVKKVLDNLYESVRSQRHLRPLFYSTDEVGVTDLVTAWDFDFDPRALADFREWLRGQYGSLASLNAEWGTDFGEWDAVEPFTTDEMIARRGDNFSPWADHRHFMNIVFAKALGRMAATVHAADPEAKAGIVGGQMPGTFGGYDYWLLSHVLDVIEPYNIGNNREMWRSLTGNRPSLITAFAATDFDVWRHWYQVLHGDRGVIIYDEKNRYLDEKGRVTRYAKKFAGLYKELTHGIVKQIAQEKPVRAPIAIHYSHPSITAKWMLEYPNQKKYWVKNGSAGERTNSEFIRLRESCVKLAEDSLSPYDFIAYGQIEEGLLTDWMPKLLLLPQSVAMSSAEAKAVRRYVENGGIVMADAIPAVMDQHCKTLEKGQLDDLFGIIRKGGAVKPSDKPGLTRSEKAAEQFSGWAESLDLSTMEELMVTGGAEAVYTDADGRPAVILRRVGKGMAIYLNLFITDYHRWRLKPTEGDQLLALFETICGLARIEAGVSVRLADGSRAQGVECHTYRFGEATMFAFNHNYQLRVSELGPMEYRDMSALEGDWEVEITLPVSGVVYDVRTGKRLTDGNVVKGVIPTYSPLIVSVLPERVEDLCVDLEPVERGGWLTANIRLQGKVLGNAHVVNLWLEGPEGAIMPPTQQNIVLKNGVGYWNYPIPMNQKEGSYLLHARDVLTGASAEAVFTL